LDGLYDLKQDIWIDALKIEDQLIAKPARNPSRKTLIPLPLHFISVLNNVAIITALTAFKVGRNDLIRAQAAFRNLSI